MRRAIAAGTLLGVLLTACGGGGATNEPSPPVPDPDDVVLQVEFRGGFVGPNDPFSQLPSFAMLGDGRVLRPGAVPAIFPGPLVAPLMERRLSGEGVQRVLGEVAATGLFGTGREFRSGGVADAPDTVFTLRIGDRQTVVTINAFGLVDGRGLTPDEARAHRVLSALSDHLLSLDQWLPASAWAEGAWRTYRPDAYRLLVLQTDATEQEPNGIGFNLAAWPGTTAPQGGLDVGRGGRCLVVEGDDASAWGAAIAQANQLTRWTAGSERYQVQPRPFLPGEARECPGA